MKAIEININWRQCFKVAGLMLLIVGAGSCASAQETNSDEVACDNIKQFAPGLNDRLKSFIFDGFPAENRKKGRRI